MLDEKSVVTQAHEI
jgi:hypothetical protein